MKSLKNILLTLGTAGLIGLSNGCTCETQTKPNISKKRETVLDHVYIDSQKNVSVDYTLQNGKLIRTSIGALIETTQTGERLTGIVSIYKVLEENKSPVLVDYYYNDRDTPSYREILLPKKSKDYLISIEKIEADK